MSARFRKRHYLGCVTALLLWPPTGQSCSTDPPTVAAAPHSLLFVARGSTLYVHAYPSLRLLLTHQWSQHWQRIHGVSTVPSDPSDGEGGLLCVWGGHWWQLLRLTLSPASLLAHASSGRLSDWVWNVSCFTCPPTCATPSPPSTVDVVACLAHNSVAVSSVSLICVDAPLHASVVREVQCETRCLLYSATTTGPCVHSFCVLAGTVLASTLLWSPSSIHPSSPLTLHAHEGSVFSIVASSTMSSSSPFPASFSSASDDRTIRRFTLSSTSPSLSYSEDWVSYGHAARVWRVMEGGGGRVVSTGEDDTVRVWKDGREVDVWRERGRKGGIWALEVDRRRGVVLAGSMDGRVRVLHMQVDDDRKATQRTEDDERVDMLRWPLTALVPPDDGAGQRDVEYCRVLIRGAGEADFFLATSCQRIVHFCRPPQSSDFPAASLLFVSALHSINTLCLSSDGRCLAVGDNRGNLTVLSLHHRPPSPSSLHEVTIAPSAHVGGISFIFFLPPSFASPTSARFMLTADALGDVKLWSISGGDGAIAANAVAHFRLPTRAHMTCALVLHRDEDQQLLCGDSKGNAYVYQLTFSAEGVVIITPAGRLCGAHSSFSCLVELDDGRLLSVGKDGCLHRLDLCRSTSAPPPADAGWFAKHNAAQPDGSGHHSAHLYALTVRSTSRVPVAWLVAVHVASSPTSSPSSLLVAGFTTSSFHVWDVDAQLRLLSVPSGDHNRPFAFGVTDSTLSFLYAAHTTSSASIIACSAPRPRGASAPSIGAAFHSRLVTAVRVLHHSAERTLIATASEDALMKAWAVHADPVEDVTLLTTFSDHPDGIRAMSVLTIADGDALLFTAGSKDHLRAYRLRDGATGDVESLGVAGCATVVKRGGRPWVESDVKVRHDSADVLEQADLRIMAVLAVPSPPSSADVRVAVGDSAGRLRLYGFDPASAPSPFTLRFTSAEHGHPVISLAACDSSVLVSGDTGGVVCVWSMEAAAAPRLLSRRLVHQAGVNACLLHPVFAVTGASSPSRYVLVSGGDDGCLCVAVFSVCPVFVLHWQAVREAAHDSAIRCLALHAGRLLSSGYDQRLRLWTVPALGGTEESEPATRLCAVRLGGVQLELADVSAMDAVDGRVFIGGQGMSVVDVFVESYRYVSTPHVAMALQRREELRT